MIYSHWQWDLHDKTHNVWLASKKLVEVGWAVATKSHIALAPWEESKRDKFRKSVV